MPPHNSSGGRAWRSTGLSFTPETGDPPGPASRRGGQTGAEQFARPRGGLPAGQEGVVRVVVLPLAVAPREQDVVPREPVADEGHVFGPGVVVDDVGVRQVHLVGRPNRVAR